MICHLKTPAMVKEIGLQTLLSEHGFSDIWENQGILNHKMFIGIFKQRVIDNFVQKWYSDLEKGNILSLLYTFIKTDFCLSEYLEKGIPRPIRVNLTRLRLSSHNLTIETGRHGSNIVPRPDRKCPCCRSDVIKDEFHFVIQCEAYKEIRNTYIKPYFL